MSTTDYRLRFTVAGRTLLFRDLQVMQIAGFGRGSTGDFRHLLPASLPPGCDGYLVHSLTTTTPGEPLEETPGLLSCVLETYPRHLTRLEGSFEDFLQGLSSKTRSTLRRKVRKFAAEDGRGDVAEIEWRCYATADAMAAFLDTAVPLGEQTYQARLFDGAIPGDREFREEAIALAARGRARGYLLFKAGEAVAYLYTPLEDNRHVYAYLGYDETHARLSPGTVLQYLVHQRLFEEGSAELFDFTEGDGAHKRLFANEHRECATVVCVRDTLGMRLTLGAYQLWNHAVAAARDKAERYQLSGRLRKLLR